jgi:hypothetical protein
LYTAFADRLPTQNNIHKSSKDRKKRNMGCEITLFFFELLTLFNILKHEISAEQDIHFSPCYQNVHEMMKALIIKGFSVFQMVIML